MDHPYLLNFATVYLCCVIDGTDLKDILHSRWLNYLFLLLNLLLSIDLPLYHLFFFWSSNLETNYLLFYITIFLWFYDSSGLSVAFRIVVNFYVLFSPPPSKIFITFETFNSLSFLSTSLLHFITCTSIFK